MLDGTKILAETYTHEVTGETRTLYYFYDEKGDVAGFEYKGNAYFYQKNIQGDVLRVCDEGGSIVAEYTYDAWGKVLSVTDAKGNAITDNTHVANVNPFRYRSYYYDSETGFYYLNSRYYDPEVGRFLNADGIIGANGGITGYNLFAYCNNNPVIYSDPSGNMMFDFGWGRIYAFPFLFRPPKASITFNMEYDLGQNWRARFDRGTVGNEDHVHIWKEGEDSREWIMTLTGKMSHENKSEKGSPPKKVLKKLKDKTDFDYEKKRKDFMNKDLVTVGTQYGLTVVYYTDGTIYVGGEYYYTNSPYYSEDLWRPTSVRTPVPFVFFPINPIFDFSYGISFFYEFFAPAFS